MKTAADSQVQYNTCETCGATDGKAGNLFKVPGSPNECLNCYKTRESGEVVVHACLDRTEEQIQRTMNILDEQTTTDDPIFFHVDDAMDALEDQCDLVYERLVDDIRLEPDSFQLALRCDLHTAAECPDKHVYSCPLFSFSCKKTEVHWQAGQPAQVHYAVNAWQEG